MKNKLKATQELIRSIMRLYPNVTVTVNGSSDFIVKDIKNEDVIVINMSRSFPGSVPFS